MAVFDLRDRRVWVAGHNGMVGAALRRRLAGEGCEVLIAPHQEIDLRRQDATWDWLAAARPDAVFVAAARVGGIEANARHPAEFLHDNLAIAGNIIHGAYRTSVAKLLFIGSSAVYPRLAAQPMAEELLLTGPLDPSHESYAIAKIAGLKLCQAYRRQYGCDFLTVLPTNLYGPGDRFDPDSGHVVPALMMKAHAAKEAAAETLPVWGSGRPRRELLYVDDLADALVFLMQHDADGDVVNVGTGEDLTIGEIATAICAAVGFSGQLAFDASKPDGVPRKLLDCGRLHRSGWRHRTALADGLAATYRWYLANRAHRSAANR